jgi:hypothetical protein
MPPYKQRSPSINNFQQQNPYQFTELTAIVLCKQITAVSQANSYTFKVISSV